MARIKLSVPEKSHFSTTIKLRISDINYGGHLGNDAVLSLAHEARMQFLAHYGWKELDVAGCGLIQSDTAIVYKSEGYYGDEIQIDISIYDMHRCGFDIFYAMKNLSSGKDLAYVKTGMITYDYSKAKVMGLPVVFKDKFTD